MKEHKDRFDEKLSKLARNEACGLDRMAGLGEGARRKEVLNIMISCSESDQSRSEARRAFRRALGADG